MNTDQYRLDLKNIQNRMLGATSGPMWHSLTIRFKTFMENTRRTWASGMFYALEEGLALEEKRKVDTSKPANWADLKAAIDDYMAINRRLEWGATIALLIDRALTEEEKKYKGESK